MAQISPLRHHDAGRGRRDIFDVPVSELLLQLGHEILLASWQLLAVREG